MRKALFCVLAALLLCTQVWAQTDLEDRFDTQSVEQAVPEDAAELMGEMTMDGDLGQGVQTILQNALKKTNGVLQTSLRSAGLLLAIVLLCAVAGTAEHPAGLRAVTLAGILGICGAGMLEVRSLIRLGQQTLDSMQSFADLLIPVMTAATAATGSYTASSALYLGTSFFSDVLMRVMTGLLIPGVYVFLSVRAADAAIDNALLSSVSDLVKWGIQASMKLLLFAFTAYLTVTGIIAGTADATAVKAAKLTLSGVVPVVGSMISDASEAVVVSAGLVRNSVGVFGMLAVLAICIGPFLQIAVQYLVLRLCTAVCGTIALKAHMSMLEALSQAMGFLLAMTGTGAVLLLISCVCYLRVIPA